MALRLGGQTMYGYSQTGFDTSTTDAFMSSSQTLSVPSHFTYTTSPTSSDSSYLAGMLDNSSRASGGSPLLSLSSAGDTSPLTAFGGLPQTGTLFRSTSLSGSNFGDYLEVGDVATVAGSAQPSPSTSPSAHDFSGFNGLLWPSSADGSGTNDGIYGSYNGGSGSRGFDDISPLTDRSQYASPQESWFSGSLSNADDDSHNTSLSPHIAYQSEDLTLDIPGTHGLSADTFSFPAVSQSIASWSSMPTLDSTTTGGFQLPPAMKDSSKPARFSNAGLPQVVTTSYNDTDIGSSIIGIGGSSSSVRKAGKNDGSTGGHKRGSLGSRRSSNVGSRSTNRSSSPYDTTSATSPNRKTQPSPKHGRGSGSKGGSDGSSKNKFVCTRPDCNGPVFTRMADLERHIRHIHTDADKKERFLCDYNSCSRSATPFHRKDHYREHLREYHLEDLLKRGSNANHHTAASSSSAGASGPDSLSPSTAASSTADLKRNKKLLQETQLQNCKTENEWWRCARCLQRVDIAGRGWTCPGCKGSIEEPRKSIRMSRAAAAMAQTSTQSMGMPAGWGTYSDMSLEPY
ncbi:hypothetical protein Sste5346_000846 [Sporothrix stenoceras]|uniref:C2H2-type domain-containing protein n=1 Tax=Sporothrix stenoceras TaxID=5173 RepID=A0ABR3ZR37_9PEZI